MARPVGVTGQGDVVQARWAFGVAQLERKLRDEGGELLPSPPQLNFNSPPDQPTAHQYPAWLQTIMKGKRTQPRGTGPSGFAAKAFPARWALR